ncbi:winged helix-turn-helix domain-containing protein [Streptomyces sp. RB6PN25]|uniref:Winged helix-turn-helix domain-containing protein n=1 Tax=Streptomyces humicola TaxID=2953240 RepID=A0ABT1PWC7_9ACTN|nr:winged helix-turn-helix domain-containing protein [Streptomyces humicola]MCQ4080840.1 winged helix-turn-helix domain-containing protein [Streptomyces humicola]
MTVALPSPAPVPTLHPAPRRLRLASEEEPSRPASDGASPLVAYLVLLPEDTDPVALFARTGLRPHIRSVDLDDIPNPSLDVLGSLRVGDNSPVRSGPYPSEGPVRIDTGRHVAELDGAELDLTYMEFALLARLVERPEQVHSREQLVRHVSIPAGSTRVRSAHPRGWSPGTKADSAALTEDGPPSPRGDGQASYRSTHTAFVKGRP